MCGRLVAWLLVLALCSISIKTTNSQASVGCPSRADIYFVLDGSRSVTQEEFRQQKKFLQNLIEHFPVSRHTNQLGVVRLGLNGAQILLSLNTMRSKNDLIQAISKIKARPGRARPTVAQGLDKVQEGLFGPSGGGRPGADKIAVIISDGQTKLGSRLNQIINRLHSNGLNPIIAIRVGRQVTLHQAQRMASNSNSAFKVNTYRQLANIRTSVSHLFCNGKVQVQRPRPQVSQPRVTLPPSTASWTQWSGWSTCSRRCGGGNQARVRSCTGGTFCRGGGRQTRDCNQHACFSAPRPTQPPTPPPTQPPPPPTVSAPARDDYFCDVPDALQSGEIEIKLDSAKIGGLISVDSLYDNGIGIHQTFVEELCEKGEAYLEQFRYVKHSK